MVSEWCARFLSYRELARRELSVPTALDTCPQCKDVLPRIVKEGLDPDDKSRPHPPYTNANVLQGRGPRGGHTFACSRRWWHLGRRSTCPFCTTPGIPVVAPADATTLVMACATGRGGPSHPGEDEVGLRGDSPRR